MKSLCAQGREKGMKLMAGGELSWPSLRAKGSPENTVQTSTTSEFAIKSTSKLC